MLERLQGDEAHGGGYEICLHSRRLPAEAATTQPGRGRTSDLRVRAHQQRDSEHQGGAPSMRIRSLTIWAVAVCLLAPLSAYSQSLGAAAAAESRRRAAARGTGGVSTQSGQQTTSTNTSSSSTSSTSSTSSSGDRAQARRVRRAAARGRGGSPPRLASCPSCPSPLRASGRVAAAAAARRVRSPRAAPRAASTRIRCCSRCATRA
jgi:hypothetical protein